MATIDPVRALFEGLDELRRADYHDLDQWATRGGMAEDHVARFLLGFVTALFVRLGCPDVTLLRFVARCAELARAEARQRDRREVTS